MTAQAAFGSWIFFLGLIACGVLVLAFGIAVFIVVLSWVRKRDE